MIMGEIKRGKNIGYKSGHEYIWQACNLCGKERWVQIRQGKPTTQHCRYCAKGGRKCRSWKGGKHIDNQGYIKLYLTSDDPHYPMANKQHYILEHRLVMARHLGRMLQTTEIVHHKNGIKTDNIIKNLELISRANHIIYDRICAQCELRKEIRLLRWELKQFKEANKLC